MTGNENNNCYINRCCSVKLLALVLALVAVIWWLRSPNYNNSNNFCNVNTNGNANNNNANNSNGVSPAISQVFDNKNDGLQVVAKVNQTRVKGEQLPVYITMGIYKSSFKYVCTDASCMAEKSALFCFMYRDYVVNLHKLFYYIEGE